MDIQVLSPGCVRVGVTEEECSRFGISYGSFSPASIPARLFIAAALSRLEELGLLASRPQKLTAEVFEDGGGLAVYISGKALNCLPAPKQENSPDEPPESPDPRGEEVTLLRTPAEVVAAAERLPEYAPAELYSLGKRGYALIAIAGSPLTGGGSGFLAAAIKEHGKLLSDAPKKMLSGIIID